MSNLSSGIVVACQDEAELSSDDIAEARPSKKRAKPGGGGGAAARRKRSADDLDMDEGVGMEVGCLVVTTSLEGDAKSSRMLAAAQTR